jgi:hypothetical protein
LQEIPIVRAPELAEELLDELLALELEELLGVVPAVVPPPQAASPITMTTARRIANTFFIFFLLKHFFSIYYSNWMPQ